MARAADLRRIALALEGTSEAPHFDRAAFKVARIYATPAPDGKTANLNFAPDAFTPIDNAWGRQGWTTAKLAALRGAELKDALTIAWRHAQRRKPASRKRNAS